MSWLPCHLLVLRGPPQLQPIVSIPQTGRERKGEGPKGPAASVRLSLRSFLGSPTQQLSHISKA